MSGKYANGKSVLVEPTAATLHVPNVSCQAISFKGPAAL